MIEGLDRSRRNLDTQNPKLIELSFPADPIERLGIILSGINSGPKFALMFLFPRFGNYIPTNDLVDKFVHVLSQSKSGYKVGDRHTKTNIESYCEQSLMQVGLVAKVFKASPDPTEPALGFALTNVGEKYGKRAAALAVNFENETGLSIYHIFGQTATGSKDKKKNLRRAPSLRASILLYLYNNLQNEINIHTLMQALPYYSFISLKIALDELVKYKVIKENINDRAYMHYRPTNKAVPSSQRIGAYKKGAQVLQTIIDICKTKADVTVQDILEVAKPTSNDTKSILRQKRLIRSIVQDLRRNGYLEKRVEKLDTSFKTYTIQGQDIGVLVVEKFIKPLLLLMQDNEELIKLLDRELIPKIEANLEQYLSKSVDIYFPYSLGDRRRQMLNKVDLRIVKSLKTARNVGLTVDELSIMTKTNISSIRKRLRRLIELEKITKKEGGRGHIDIYHINDHTSTSNIE